MISLVGNTGFVGSNLAASYSFDGLYNSKNIMEAFGTSPDILYYAGVPAKKFIANKFPHEDLAIIENAISNIKKINPKKIVLISTVDVYKDPNGKDENSKMETDGLLPYGANRLKLEEHVQESFTDYLILRLPALYGKNLKKNFIYDYINFIPAMLTDKKIEELGENSPAIFNFYNNGNNGFYKVREDIDRKELRAIFAKADFSALNFTDSRSVFQLYNLEYLYKDIQIAIKSDIKILNIATEPVSAAEIYKTLTRKEFINEMSGNPACYDFRTTQYKSFGGNGGYITQAVEILKDIKKYVENNRIDF